MIGASLSGQELYGRIFLLLKVSVRRHSSEDFAAKSISGLGRPHYNAVAIIEEKHEERIDHHFKVILSQIIPQSSNKPNRQHSLFLYVSI